ncbi:MAG TPA: hypothetical protein VEU08_17750, partial [Vicinamibacterales bacterium]|nr:hypothetical protein [Vicinamibacterales bacterium]
VFAGSVVAVFASHVIDQAKRQVTEARKLSNYRLKARIGRGGVTVGAAGSGAVYDMLNEDKRNAVEIIVEERAAARDPEPRWQPARSQQAPPLAPRPAALQPAEPGR